VKFCVLASGSKGNATWIEEGQKAILIDNGLSAKELKARADCRGLNLNRLMAVVVSHEHSDHVKGVGPLARQLDLTVYGTLGTLKAAASSLQGLRLKTFKSGDELDLKFMRLTAVSVSHDAAEPVAFVICGQSGRLGLLTDLGTPTHLVRESFRELNALIVEFNHDLEMLVEGPYPAFLKQRVKGNLGHLSNEAGAKLLGRLCHEGLAKVILGHLSDINNTPKLALKEARRVLDQLGANPDVLAAEQVKPTQVFEI
jgi:phosphoribosyl 1,2-cyclic phosphodiesterase